MVAGSVDIIMLVTLPSMQQPPRHEHPLTWPGDDSTDGEADDEGFGRWASTGAHAEHSFEA